MFRLPYKLVLGTCAMHPGKCCGVMVSEVCGIYLILKDRLLISGYFRKAPISEGLFALYAHIICH